MLWVMEIFRSPFDLYYGAKLNKVKFNIDKRNGKQNASTSKNELLASKHLIQEFKMENLCWF